jgi:hypothetical protein
VYGTDKFSFDEALGNFKEISQNQSPYCGVGG